MRIELVIFRLNRPLGGAERYTRDLAIEFARRGHDVSVVAQEIDHDLFDGAGVQLVEIESHGWGRTHRLHRFLSAVDERQKRTDAEVVHAMLPIRSADVYQPHAGFEAIAMRPGHRWKRWTSRINLKRRYAEIVEATMLTDVRQPKVMCLSDRTREEAKRYFALDDRQFVTVQHGIDTERFRPATVAERQATRRVLGWSPEDVVMMFIGHDFERKNLAGAIRACGAQSRSDHDERPMLAVVGAGRVRKYSAIAERLGLIGRVQFLGSREDVPQLLAASDGLLLPSHDEPYGLTAIEAMACGVVPIVSRACGVSEVIVHETDGWVVGSQTDLNAAVARMMKADVRTRMGKACELRREGLSFARHVDRVEEIYRSRRGDPARARVSRGSTDGSLGSTNASRG